MISMHQSRQPLTEFDRPRLVRHVLLAIYIMPTPYDYTIILCRYSCVSCKPSRFLFQRQSICILVRCFPVLRIASAGHVGISSKETPLPSVHVPVHPPIVNRRPTSTPRPSIPSLILSGISPSIVARALISPSASFVAPIRGYVGINVCSCASTAWPSPGRTVPPVFGVISITWSVLRRRPALRPSISLPCWPAFVSIPTAVNTASAISITTVEAGRGVVCVGANTHGATLWGWW